MAAWTFTTTRTTAYKSPQPKHYHEEDSMRHPTPRGGARKGAGRKARADAACTKWIKIRATEAEQAAFVAAGGSEWFRAALAGAQRQKNKKSPLTHPSTG